MGGSYIKGKSTWLILQVLCYIHIFPNIVLSVNQLLNDNFVASQVRRAVTEEELYRMIEFKCLAAVCCDFNHTAHNRLVLLKWGRTASAFPSVDHYWRERRHGERREHKKDTLFFWVQMNSVAGQFSSGSNQSNHLLISGPPIQKN